MAELVTLPELCRWLELDDPVDQDEEDRGHLLIEKVSGMVLGYLGRPSLTATVAATVDGSGTRTLLIPGDHLLDVSSVVEDPRDAATELVDGTGFEWSSTGILYRIDGGIFVRRPRWYEVVFEFGLTEPEIDTVKAVVLRVAARTLTNPEGLATESAGGYVSGFAFDATRLSHLADPERRDLDPLVVERGGGLGAIEASGS
jgi:hypothetical protein